MKIKLIVEDLRKWNGDVNGFKVTKVMNSTYWQIGSYLSKDQIDQHITEDVEVTILPSKL